MQAAPCLSLSLTTSSPLVPGAGLKKEKESQGIEYLLHHTGIEILYST